MFTKKYEFTEVKKRDGRIVPFDQSRITSAVSRAMQAVGEGDPVKDAERVSEQVLSALSKKFPAGSVPDIETIQDIVESQLILMDFAKTAKAYILYRNERAKIRNQKRDIPEGIKKLADESKKYFRNPLAEFIYYRTYSRWIEEEGRRETWIETVDRYLAFMRENLGSKLTSDEYAELRESILHQEVMPSMRLMWSAGKAARSSNVAAFNCSYIAPIKIEDFAEIMYILMCGTGVGFSVESQTIQQLPQIKKRNGAPVKVHHYIIEDSKESWADAFTFGLKAWWNGEDVKFDYSNIRPAGARLRTMGGKSSGPEPLRALLEFAHHKILSKQGKRLSNIDAHDIICKTGDVVVMGGVRRCLPQNTLIHTKNGLKTIKNIGLGEEVLTIGGEYRKVIASEYTGQRQLLNIHTQLGTFQSTPEHRWAVLSDLEGNVRWVEAAKLTSQDTLVHIPYVIPGKKTALPLYQYQKPKYSTTTKDIIIPDLDEEIAWLIGYFHGDGYVYRPSSTYGEIMFACAPDMPKTAARLENNLKRFGIRSWTKTTAYDRAIRVRVKSNQLANYFYQFKQPKESIRVPDFILEGTPEIRAAYLSGVFDADGSVKSKNEKKVRPIIASSIYPDWLRQLRALAASIGVSANIKQNRPAKKNWQALYQLVPVSIESFLRFKKLMINHGSEKWRNDSTSMERKKEQNSFVVPRNLLAQSYYKKLFESAYYVPSSKIALSFSRFEKTLERQTNLAVTTQVALREEVPLGNFPDLLQGQRYYRPVKIKSLTPANIDETYDIQVERDECFVAEGMLVHNSALISLSDLDDPEMRDAKKGAFYIKEPQRALANNSAAYNEKPTATQFMEEWLALAQSGSGERGIFNRGGLAKQLPERRWKVFKEDAETAGTNPCGEIILKSKEFCNLSEVVCRLEDTEDSLIKKTRLAAILGTYQSTLTNFPYLSKEWQRNCNEERLLGVSLTGQWDSPAVRNAETLRKIKEEAIRTNKEYAKRFGINESACITCVKPSGTVSQLVDAASGGHPRHSSHYIRRVRIAATDSLFQMLKDQKVHYYPEVGQTTGSASTYVLEFPVKAPEGAVFKNDLTAIEQLEHWKMVKKNFTEHNPSVTISVGENEWIGVSNWLYENWDILGGLSFLSRDNHVYTLAPYEEISKERYEEMIVSFPEIDFSQIIIYEHEDQTQGAKELACVAGVCEIEEIPAEKVAVSA